MRARVLVVIATVVHLAACATVPITGRSQLSLVSDQAMVAAADQHFLRFMRQAHGRNAVLQASESPAARQQIEMVDRVSRRVIDASGLANQFRWEVVVVKGPAANALVLPNGKIVVFTGMLPVARDEGGLATIIGHEVGHVLAKHQAERLSQRLLAEVTLATVDLALAIKSPRYRQPIGAALGLGALFGVLLPFSREHESEADRIGLHLMAKAGYDPEQAIGVWERMEAAGGTGPWEFVNTHPSPGTRREQIRGWLAEVRGLYRPVVAEKETQTQHSEKVARLVAEIVAENRAKAEAAWLSFAAREQSREKPASTQASTPPVVSALSGSPEPASSETAPSEPEALVAARPDIKIGYWFRMQEEGRKAASTWRYRRTERCTVGQCYVFQGDSDETINILTKDLAVLEVREPAGVTKFRPPMPLYRWPLVVGTYWSEAIVMIYPTGERRSLTVEGRVTAYEPVTTQAGSFKAYKLRIAMGGRMRDVWYAPEINTVVRTQTYQGGRVVSRGELIEYDRSLANTRSAETPPATTRAVGESAR